MVIVCEVMDMGFLIVIYSLFSFFRLQFRGYERGFFELYVVSTLKRDFI